MYIFAFNPSELLHVSIYLDILKLLSTYVCSMFIIPQNLPRSPFDDVGNTLFRKVGKYISVSTA